MKMKLVLALVAINAVSLVACTHETTTEERSQPSLEQEESSAEEAKETQDTTTSTEQEALSPQGIRPKCNKWCCPGDPPPCP
jgi:hypothetical protein